MSVEKLPPDKLVEVLSFRSQKLLNEMIDITDPATRPAIQASAIRQSSLGDLDSLPVEVLHDILASLDFQSLSRISRTSVRGKQVVESLPAYRDMMDHAPQALTALGRSRLIQHHTAAAVYETLQSQECWSCQQFGAFLFLPTCQRCCYECLNRNPALRVLPLSSAVKCFGLSRHMLKTKLPVMFSIPGAYRHVRYSRRFYLVSIKAAKDLAMAIHGSQLAMLEETASLWDGELLWLQNHSLEPLQEDPKMMPRETRFWPDRYFGVASLPFPFVGIGHAVETGLWCHGCERASTRIGWGHSTIQGLKIPPQLDLRTVLKSLSQHARTKDDFLEHVKTCPGAAKFLEAFWMDAISSVLEKSPDTLYDALLGIVF